MQKKASERRRELHFLVERNFLGHKMEISDFCSGHLNENHLWKPPKQASTEPCWENSKKQPVLSKEAVRFDSSSLENKEKELSKTVGQMSDRLADFTLGIDYSVPGKLAVLNPTSQSPRDKLFTKVLTEDDNIVLKDLYRETPRTSAMSRARNDIICKNEEGSRKGSLIDRKILVEEYPANKLLTPLPSARTDPAEIHDKMQQDVSTCDEEPKFYLLEPTRTKQYKNLVAHRNNVVRERETCETAMMSGHKSVEHLERKLSENLQRLGEKGNIPNFHRLQIFAEVFDDLTHDSPLFGPILHEIKLYYDKHISDLLDSAPPQHHVLSNEVDKLLSSGIVQPGAVQTAQDLLHGIEENILIALNNEAKLKNELSIQMKRVSDMQSIVEERIQAVIKDNSEKTHVLTEAEEVEQLKCDCWKMIDKINNIREQLNKEFTPVAICAHFDQCCQEAEIEVQQLKQEKSNLQKDIDKMERELSSFLNECDIPERVEKRIWNLVDNPKPILMDSEDDFLTGNQVSDEETNLEEDDTPWRWYIS